MKQKKLTEKGIMQRAENQMVLDAIDWFNSKDHKLVEIDRLRYCSAWVYKYNDCYVLESYRTAIAIIRFCDGCMYDFLRYVYGYTNTSCQHLAKFAHDYAAQKRYTWRSV